MKNPWIVVAVLVVVLVGGSVVYSQFAASQSNEGVEVVDVHVKGNPDAEVTLTEYGDFSCGACGQAYPFVQDLVETYGDDLRFEYKHFAFLQLGPVSAMAAEAAGQQGEFFAYHDALFENQSEWSQSATPQRYFEQYAEEIGLDMEQWEQHRTASLLRDKVQADMAEGREMGVSGTPTFFLNGERLEFQTYEDIRTAIEAELGVEGDTSDESSESEPNGSSASGTVEFSL